MLELDFHYNSNDPLSLETGTSVERRRLEQQSRGSQYSTLSTLPGGWLESTLTNLSSKPGIPQYAVQRSLHHHWSLASSMRCADKSSDDMTCLLESMGIRYRPESYLAVILDQSFSQLISNGYAAGAYWKKSNLETPLVSVLSNSTRSYFYIQSVASNMKEKLLAPKYQGYRQREVSNGNLLETDDCLDSMEYCWNLQDTYRPPDGSNLTEEQSEIDWDVFG